MSPASGYPLLELLGAVAARQAGSLPPVSVPGGRLEVRGLSMRPDGLALDLTGFGPLGLTTEGTLHITVASVGSEHAWLALSAEGGRAFTAAANTALAAGGLLEPLARALLGRPLQRGVELSGSQVRLHYAELLAALAETPR